MTAFFRFLECETGSVILDGQDISRLQLGKLRDKLTIIQQDPALFTGTVRSNLDFGGNFTEDAHLWAALRAVGLSGHERARIQTLDAPVIEGGDNYSAGERQLLALARGLIRMPSSALVVRNIYHFQNISSNLAHRF